MEALIAFVVVILILVIALGIFVAKWSKEDTENDLKDLEKIGNKISLEKHTLAVKREQEISDKYEKLRNSRTTDIN